MNKLIALGSLFCLSVLSGCSLSTLQLKSRAASDLACDEEAQIQQVDSTTTQAEGCGRKLSYTWQCSKNGDGGVGCRWERNGGRFIVSKLSLDASNMGLATASAEAETSSGDSSSDDDDDE